MLREIVLDTETTGLDARKGDRLVELGCVEIINRIPTGREFHAYICPEDRAVHPEAEQIHGLSNALMLRHVLQHNQEAARDDYATLAQVLEPGCAGQGSQAQCALLIDRLDQLITASGVAPRLRDHGITQADIPTLAREAMKQQRLLVNNPCAIDEADARRLYQAAW